MTNHSSPIDPSKLTKQLEEFAEKRTDVLDTIEATKGKQYAAALATVVSVAGTLRTTNTMICGEVPQDIIHQVALQQMKVLDQLQTVLVNLLFPPDRDLAAALRNMAEQNEFTKNIDTLITQREEAENKLNITIMGDLPPKHRKDD